MPGRLAALVVVVAFALPLPAGAQPRAPEAHADQVAAGTLSPPLTPTGSTVILELPVSPTTNSGAYYFQIQPLGGARALSATDGWVTWNPATASAPPVRVTMALPIAPAPGALTPARVTVTFSDGTSAALDASVPLAERAADTGAPPLPLTLHGLLPGSGPDAATPLLAGHPLLPAFAALSASVSMAAPVLASPIAPAPAPARPASPTTLLKGPREIEPEVIPSPRSTSPGGVIRLIYSILNFEESEVRVRLRPELPPGWTNLNPEITGQELVIEALDEVDGELLVMAAKDARPGDRVIVKLVAEVVGEAGVYEGRNPVTITRGGGLRPGQTALTGTTSAGLSRVSASGTGNARTAGGVVLSGQLDKETTVSLSAGRDLNDIVTNFRYNFEPVRIAGTLRRPGLEVAMGNILFSGGTALTGPFVRGRGGSIRKTTGHTIGDLALVQPTTYAGDAAGYLVRGRVGVNRTFGSVSFVASDFMRPTGYTTLLPPVTVLDPDEAQRQEIERRLAAGAARNRVLGAGIETELRRGNAHRFTARTGALSLSNASGLQRTAPSSEAGYGYLGRSHTLNLRWRDMPDSMPGVQIGGDETWVDGSVRVYKDTWLFAQTFRSAYEITGQASSSTNNGTSLGTRWSRRAVRMEARANYRESAYGPTTVRRSGSMNMGLPLRMLSLNAGAEVGETEGPRGVQPLGFYNASLRWTGEDGFASFMLSQVRNGPQPLQRRADLLGSVKLGLYELAGGAWVTQGYVSGGHPGVWSSVGVPIFLDLTAVAGVEYAPLNWTDRPDWRGSFNLRRPLTLSLDFLKGNGR